MAAKGDNMDIDEGLYSRQLYVLGHDAMRRMAASNLLIAGCKGVGIEAAKNLALAGVKSITLYDASPVALPDLSSNFYFSEADVGKNRAEVSAAKLRDLNPYVDIRVHAGELDEAAIKQFQVVLMSDETFERALQVDEVCHANGICFVACQSRGVFGNIFVDFGPAFVVNDTNGEQALSAMISGVTQEEVGMVTTLDEVRHGLETGDFVTFTEVKGMAELNAIEPVEIKVTGPYTFSISDTSKFGAYVSGGYVKQVKMPATIPFKKMRESIAAPEFLISDFAKIDRQEQLLIGFQAVDAFLAKNKALPMPGNRAQAAEVVALAEEINSSAKLVDKIDAKLVTLLSSNARGDLSPMAAVLGGIVAQEVLKGCSGKFMPIRQWLMYDNTECLPEEPLPEAEYQMKGSRYDGQIAVFGNAFQEKLLALNYFLVGAGAIGCEMLKNWAMMGIGCGPGGCIHVTDMDTIEKSNLNRQFLFRATDIQKLKATCAAEAVSKMNAAINIKCYSTRVGPDTEELFDDKFFEDLDGVCNALDNVQARLYVDQRCIYYQKSLLESGTLGTKGNVQVVVPNVTESYGSSRDPPEKSIPICTLKNFPNAIEHTIQWARDEFEGVYKQGMEDAGAFGTDPEFLVKLKKQPGTSQVTMEQLRDNLVSRRPAAFSDCVVWARLKFEELFTNNIKQLLFNFPLDMTTAAGTSFWSGPKRPPAPLVFDTSDPLHVEFVMSAANLRAYNYSIPQCRDVEAVKAAALDVMVPEFSPQKGVKIQVTEAEAEAAAAGVDVDDMALDKLAASLPPAADVAAMRLTPIEFEKDDDANFHMDYIAACSNLRATNYAIAVASKHETKLIAGKIIPAIATTTAMVTGFVCFELIKLVMAAPIEAYKNAFVNLALPFFAFSEPIAAPSRKFRTWDWSLWSRIDISMGDISLQAFIDHFQKEMNLEVSMISCGVSIIYSAFMTSKKKLEERLPMPMSQLVQSIAKVEIPQSQKYLVLEVCCTDEDDEDVETPYVRMKFRD
mmetsp:Transcript_47391/g.112774  ORF Transcript_47391/g.112774 Transcript_47391/m.112774 type:complete len:1011 (+) Transcript_47391:93-3125(+)|eukprot:CAMPEP_0180130018 /NCGR_PEP_ID=MMETSP0986-20121125/7633_1 /TAXON_ID=697907 /ORGANISM="non described non described, Strain CCMP2293" /LENGTH=1010 /DNA_ID=CAMNT_0022069741 /DNA_START=93 /DNA_END=3125 /DNA_ORIENTATION=-